MSSKKYFLHEKGKYWCVFVSQHEISQSVHRGRRVTNLLSVCAILFGSFKYVFIIYQAPAMDYLFLPTASDAIRTQWGTVSLHA